MTAGAAQHSSHRRRPVSRPVRAQRVHLHTCARARNAPAPTVIDPEIASEGPTELLQRLNKCIKINFRLRIVLLEISQDSDASCANRRLGMGSNWPCQHNNGHELYQITKVHELSPTLALMSIACCLVTHAIAYLITRSARASTLAGIAYPFSIFDFRFRIARSSDYFVGSS